MKRLTIFLLPLLLFGCTSDDPMPGTETDIPAHLQDIENLTVYPADMEPTHDIEFTHVLTFDETYNFANETILIDNQDRLIVGRSTMRIYNEDGSFNTEMGGLGQGPGEFAGFSQVNQKIYDNRLFGIDDINSRINYFSLETLSPSGSFLLDPAVWQNLDGSQSTILYPQRYFAVSDTSLLLGFTDRIRQDFSNENDQSFTFENRDIRFYLMNLDGRIISERLFTQKETLYCPRSREFRICFPLPFYALPFFSYSFLKMSEDGNFIKAETSEIFVEVFNGEGEYLRSFYHLFQNADFNVHQLDEEIISEQTKEYYQQMDNLPETWPAFKSMLLDDENRIWLSTIKNDDSLLSWWVLDSDGKVLAKFDWPGYRQYTGYRDVGIRAVKNGYIYVTKLEDEESGTVSLAKYQFEFTERR